MGVRRTWQMAIRERNPGTRLPENPGKPDHLQTRKPGFERGQKPEFTGLILGVTQ